MRDQKMKREIKISFFGDSICFGQGVSIIHGWVPRVARDLHEDFIEREISINISNNAVNGRTTRQALESMHYEIQSSYPDILIIQFGMNDCNYWETDNGVPRVSINAYKHNIIEIIDRAKAFNISKILLNTNHPTTRTDKFAYADCSYQESNHDYNQMIREVATKSQDAILNDIEKEMLSEVNDGMDLSDYLLEDQLHLSLLGHDFYHKTTLPFLRKMIEELI